VISISNIAWDVSFDDEVSDILSSYGVSYIDIAHSKYFSNPEVVSDEQIEAVTSYWSSKGIKPLGMQSLLYGTSGLNVFGDTDVQNRMLEHLSDICRIGNKLDARKLVFGSPRNRDRSDIPDNKLLDIALPFFYELGEIASKHNVVVCLEPNPECYNSNFMTNSLDTAEIVKLVAHANIKMQLDTGAMNINDECPEKIIDSIYPYVGHIHISEPQLRPLSFDSKYHSEVAPVVNEYFPNTPLAIEMLTTSKDVCLQEIEVAVDLVKKLYKR
jgi:sugar phosphate isomerase/epimerase